MMGRDSVDELAKIAEGMEMAVADRSPVDELDSQLEAALRRADEFTLVDAEHAVEDLHQRDGGFTNADDPDFVGFDQPDPRLTLGQHSRKRRRRHPASGSTADDQDLANAVISHDSSLLHRHWPGKRKERPEPPLSPSSEVRAERRRPATLRTRSLPPLELSSNHEREAAVR